MSLGLYCLGNIMLSQTFKPMVVQLSFAGCTTIVTASDHSIIPHQLSYNSPCSPIDITYLNINTLRCDVSDFQNIPESV